MSFYLYYSQREPESTISSTWFTISPGHRIRGPSTSEDLREHAKTCAEVLCLANGWFLEDGEGCIKLISVLGQWVAELRVTQKEVLPKKVYLARVYDRPGGGKERGGKKSG